MNKKTIIWGIIGCGDVAEVKSGPAFQKCNNSELLAVMRRDSQKAKDFAGRHRVQLWYDDATKLLKNNNINAVYVATPPSSHLEYALKALKAGKHVYLEKPMVLNKEEALVLCDYVKRSANKLVVAHYRRQLPIYLKVKELINSNTIGDIKFIDLKYLKTYDSSLDNNWRLNSAISGGGQFHDLAPHQIDLMYHFFGDIYSAKGFSSNLEGNNQVSEIINGVISFKNGIQFRGIWGFDVPEYLEQDNCIIYGSLGTISFSFYGDEVKVTFNKETKTYNLNNPVNVQQPLIQESINYFLGKRTNPCSVEEGVIVTTIMDAFTNTIK